MMIFINEVSKLSVVPKLMWEGFVKMLSCYAPHLGEELWQKLGHDGTVAYESWPAIDEKYSADDTKTIAVMVNGKLRATFQAASGTPKDELEKKALAEESAVKHIEGKKNC